MSQCSARVFPKHGPFRGKPCSKPVAVERDGKPYCKVHDPEAVKAKNDKRYAAYQAEAAERTKVHQLNAAAPYLLEACKASLPVFRELTRRGVEKLDGMALDNSRIHELLE